MQLLTEALPPRAALQQAVRLLRWLTAVFGILAMSVGAAPPAWWGALPLPAAALVLAFGGLAGTTVMARARLRVAGFEGAPKLISDVARSKQALFVAPCALLAYCLVLLSRVVPAPVLTPGGIGWVLAGAVVVTLGLLLAERYVAAIPKSILPEAPALGRLLAVPVAVMPLCALLLAARGAGFPGTATGIIVLDVAIGALALELALRALVRPFLPPPAPSDARAAVDSVLLRLARAPATGGVAAPLRQHFGIDFSRSFGLAYARAALLPMAVLMAMVCWGLTGVAVVPADGRIVAERFGAPVAVYGPGLHVLMPWPLGRALPVAFGPVNEVTLAGADVAAGPPTPAEAPPPASADRLWERAHPAEQSFLVAGTSGAQQSFQIVSADVRVLYRVGLTDADAIKRVTAVADPEALVRAAAGRAVGAALAPRTLQIVLSERREALAAELQQQAQQELDRLGTGLQVVSVVIEAIHPPAGAADAYHRVQAAEILANTTISTERGRAEAALAMARQQATSLLDAATAGAAEQREAATAQATSFAADRDAAQAGGRAFLLERYQENLVAALAGTPKTVLDSRLGAGEPTVVDLRPLVPAGPAARDD